MKLVQIVPELPPRYDAVGQYAFALGASLEPLGVESRYVIAGVSKQVSELSQSKTWSGDNARSFCEAIGEESDTVLLHYVGYAYARNGCPQKLVLGLKTWLSANPRRRLITLFHELYASGDFPSAAFFFSYAQKHLVRKLASLSESCTTGCAFNRDLLLALTPYIRNPVRYLPVFATIGESELKTAWSERPYAAVVFGTPGRRKALYQHESAALAEWLQKQSISEIIDIGQDLSLAPTTFCGLQVRKRGDLTNEQIRQELLQCRLGFLDYPLFLLGKSSTFAGLVAHGVTPVVFGEGKPSDGLIEGTHLVTSKTLSQAQVPEQISAAAFAWYREHALACQAHFYQSVFEQRIQPETKRTLLIFSQVSQNLGPLQVAHQLYRGAFTSAFCSLPSVVAKGEEFINKSVFSTHIPNDVPWLHPKNCAPKPGLDSFWGLINPGVLRLVLQAHTVVVYGHAYASLLASIIFAKFSFKRLLLSNDATSMIGSPLRQFLRRSLYRFLYNVVAQGVLVPSSRSKQFLVSLGITAERIHLTPYVINNASFRPSDFTQSRNVLRANQRISKGTTVLLFCAKFIARKAPLDIIQAFSKLQNKDTHLWMIGEGPLLGECKQLAKTLTLGDRITFLGMISYAELPKYYAASDVVVHPATEEPWGLIVNEALASGKPVVVSDSVGAAWDLVEGHECGLMYKSGDVAELTEKLSCLVGNEEKRSCMGSAGLTRMQAWGAEQNVQGLVEALKSIE